MSMKCVIKINEKFLKSIEKGQVKTVDTKEEAIKLTQRSTVESTCRFLNLKQIKGYVIDFETDEIIATSEDYD